MSELYVIFMSEVFNSWPISLEMSFRIKYVLRVIHCCPRTRTQYTHTRICTPGAFVDLTKNELATGYTCETFQGSQTAAFAAWKLQILGGLCTMARASSFARNKKWANTISRVNYPAVSKLKLPARLPNIYREVEFSFVMRVGSRPQESDYAKYSDCGIKRSSTRITRKREREILSDFD